MSEMPTSEKLCKHDWVGDDHCVYCENDTLKARIIELESTVGDLEEGCVALAVSPGKAYCAQCGSFKLVPYHV
jgi:hypothetical protein